MMGVLRLKPFAAIPLDSPLVAPGFWRVGELQDLLPESLASWDYQTTLRLVRQVTVSPGLAEACQLGPDAELRLSVECFSRGAQHSSFSYGVPTGVEGSSILEFSLPGRRLSKLLELTTALVVMKPGKICGPRAAKRPGSILWGDRQKVALEGRGARMPMSIESFASLSPPTRHAAWRLRKEPRWLFLHPSAGVTVVVSAEAAELVAAITQPTAGLEPAHVVLRAELQRAVARTLVSAALADEEFAGAEFEEGTMGFAIERLIGVALPGIGVEALDEQRQRDPARFEERLDGAFRRYGGVAP